MFRLTGFCLLAASAAWAQSRPTIDAVSPASLPAGLSAATIAVTGANYTTASRLVWRYGALNAVTLSTQFSPPNQLVATVPGALLTDAGDVVIAVTNQTDTQVLVSNLATINITGGLTIQSTCPLVNAVVGVPYTNNLLATGGTPPYTWSIFAGSLPAGLSLSSLGVITGAASATGSTTFDLRVVDQTNRFATIACGLSAVTSTDGGNFFIALLSPNGVVQGAVDQRVEIRGLGFEAGATAVFNTPAGASTDLVTTFVNPALMTAVIPRTLLNNVGTYSITVRKPVLTRFSFTNAEPFLVATPLAITGDCPLPAAARGVSFSTRLNGQGGFPPYRFSLTQGPLPEGVTLASDGVIAGTPNDTGAFNFSAAITDSRGNTTSRSCSVRVTGPMRITPSEVSLLGVQAGPPAEQFVSIVAGAAGSSVSAQASTQSGGNWLTAELSANRSPALVRLIATVATLAPGTYRGQAVITSDGATTPSQTIPVALTVAPAASAEILPAPGGLMFAAGRDTRFLPPKGVRLTATGGGAINFTVAASGRWLTASSSATSVSPSAPAHLAVSANPAGLDPGTYVENITVSYGAQSAVIPVTLAISPSPESLTLSADGLTYTVVQDGPPALPRQVNVLGGNGDFFWEASTPVAPGRWVADPPSNAARPATVSPFELTVDASGLAPGVYQTESRVLAPAASNAPRYVSTGLHVLPSNATPPPELVTASVIFTSRTGQDAGTRRINIRNISRSAITTDVTFNGDTRLWNVNADSPRAIAPGQSRAIEVTVNSSLLPAGVHRATLSVQGSGDPVVRMVEMLLIIGAPGRCTPTRLEIAPLSLPQNFAVTSGLPTFLEFAVRDDCGEPFVADNGLVTVSTGGIAPSNLTLTNLRDGRWAGAWVLTPPNVGPVRLDVRAQGTGLTGSFNMLGTMNPDVSPLLYLAPGGTVSVSDFRATPVAPGSAIASFGWNLAPVGRAATTFPLPIELDGARLLVGDREVPLYFAGAQQVNGQVAFDETVNVPRQFAVRSGTRVSNRVDAVIAPTAPALFVVTDANSAPLNQQNPGIAGQTVVIYCTGLGGVTPPVFAGQAASATTLSHATAPVSVTIGGRPAEVSFAGLTPGLAGLYQVNAVIPAGVSGPNLPVIVTAGGAVSGSRPITVR